MANVYTFISVVFGLLVLPFSIYGSWLLYHHVQATDLMWFIWWITIPLLIISQVVKEIAEVLAKKEGGA